MHPFNKHLVLLLLFLSFNHFSAAQSIVFQALNGPNGTAYIQHVAADNAGNLFMYQNDQIMRSTDNGDSWELAMNGIVSGSATFNRFLLAPNGTFYAHFSYGPQPVYRFEPSSNAWVTVPLPFTTFDLDGLDIDPQGRIWASTNDSHSDIHYSDNGGVSFTKIPLTGPVDGWFNFLATYNNEHNLIAVAYGASQKLFHFKANGQLQQIPNVDLIRYLGYNPYTGTAYYSSSQFFGRSTDGGLGWQGITLVPGQTYQSITNMHFDPGGKSWVHASSGTYISEDDGLTWTKEEKLSAVDGTFFRTNHTDWFVTNYCSSINFIRSTDEGSSWSDLALQFFTPNVSQIRVDNAGSIYAKTCRQNAYDFSSDGGNNWEVMKIEDSILVAVADLAITQTGKMMAIGSNNKFYRSYNNGVNWEQISEDVLPLPQFYQNIEADLTDFYIFDLVRGYKTTDFGNTWEFLNLGNNYSSTEPSFHPNGDIYLPDFINGRIYIASTDTVKYLTVANEPDATIKQAHCTSRGVTFLTLSSFFGADGFFYRILPDGNYFPDSITSINNPNSIAYITSNAQGDVFVVNGESIYKSVDDGDSWQLAGTIPTNGYLTYLYVSPDQYLYAGYNNDVIYRSTGPIGTVSTHPEPGLQTLVNSYPNPFDQFISFEISEPVLAKVYTLRIFDVLGRQVVQTDFTGPKLSLNGSKMKNGLYFYRIESAGRLIGSGKIEAR